MALGIRRSRPEWAELVVPPSVEIDARSLAIGSSTDDGNRSVPACKAEVAE